MNINNTIHLLRAFIKKQIDQLENKLRITGTHYYFVGHYYYILSSVHYVFRCSTGNSFPNWVHFLKQRNDT
jgi:hypothetical protein